MNERIIELAKKAGFNPYNYEGANAALFKKFAELIVAECMDIVANADMTELEGPDPEDVLYVACKQVKKHFGAPKCF